jgi:hypothetical protein
MDLRNRTRSAILATLCCVASALALTVLVAHPSYALPEGGSSCSVKYYCATCQASINGTGAACTAAQNKTCLKYNWLFQNSCDQYEYSCSCSCTNNVGDNNYSSMYCKADT